MSATRYFRRLPASLTDGEALDFAEQLGAADAPVLHRHQGGEVVGSVEIDEPIPYVVVALREGLA